MNPQGRQFAAALPHAHLGFAGKAACASAWTLPSPDDSAARAARWSQVRRLLVVRLDNLGDVLMSTPALRAIRDTRPDIHVTLLASPAGAAAAEALPLVNEVIAFRAPWVKHDSDEGVDAERALIDALAARSFDAAIIFTVHSQSALPAALLLRLAGIPLRMAHCRENPYGLLTDWLREPEPHAIQRHEVERQLALVGAAGFRLAADDRLQLEIGVAARVGVKRRLIRAGVDLARPYVVVHPGASAPSRRWPPADFGRAADLLAHDHQIVLTGGSADAPLVDQMLAAMHAPATVLVDELSVVELAALIEGARVLLCNNSAPAHIAAAVGTPVVVLYALTNPQHTPWRVPARVMYRDVPCRNCMKSECPLGHHECLLGVRPAQVAAAARELMGIRGDGVPLPHPCPSPGGRGVRPPSSPGRRTEGEGATHRHGVGAQWAVPDAPVAPAPAEAATELLQEHR